MISISRLAQSEKIRGSDIIHYYQNTSFTLKKVLHLSRPLWVMRQPQVPQGPVKMLLLLRSGAQRAVVRVIPIAASSCAGLRHRGEVAKVVGQESDGIVRPCLDHFQDGSTEQLSHSSLWEKLPVAIRFGHFALRHPWRSCPRPAFLLIRHCWWRPVSQQRQQEQLVPDQSWLPHCVLHMRGSGPYSKVRLR